MFYLSFKNNNDLITTIIKNFVKKELNLKRIKKDILMLVEVINYNQFIENIDMRERLISIIAEYMVPHKEYL